MTETPIRYVSFTLRTWNPYPKYKDSGIEWLGQIPVHWEVTRLKLVSRLHTGGTPAGLAGDAFDESGIPWVKPDDLLGDRGMRQPEKAVAPEAARGIGAVPKGSALICGIGTVGKFGYALSEVCTNQQINSAVFGKRFVPRFGQFVVWGLQSEFESHSNKVTIAICNKASMGLARLAIPPRAEQEAIAEFLDQETAKTDALMAKKERLIELLKEKRTALISYAVTKGLDPNVSMKDSGIEWLGQIPAHWEIGYLDKMVDTLRRITYGIVQPGDPDSEGCFMVRGQDYSFGWAEPDTIFRVGAAIERPYARARLVQGDIVMTIVGAGTGNIALVPDWLDGANITQTTARIAIDSNRGVNRYYAYVLDSKVGKVQVDLTKKGAAQPGLNLAHIAKYQVPIPPRSEQEAICGSLDKQAAKVDALIAKVQEAIERLKEYRTSLISAAVTGKIDVREEVTT